APCARGRPACRYRAAGLVTLAASLAALADAADAASSLGLDTARARGVLERARARLGFAGSTYVLAFVGGTGVGRSSLVHALAGGVVSPAGPRRPTTDAPLARVSTSARIETAALLERLGVGDVRDHADEAFSDVAILDLPDFDSTAPDHRSRVDELLPRIDAVVWVADPEKYRDALFHDDYLRRWMPRLSRQLIVVNKADLVAGEVERLRAHLASTVRDEGLGRVDVAVTSATPHGDVRELRDWIASGTADKRVASERVAAELREAAGDLAARAGVDDGAAP